MNCWCHDCGARHFVHPAPVWPFGAFLTGRDATDNLNIAWADSRMRSALVCFAYWDARGTNVTVCETIAC